MIAKNGFFYPNLGALWLMVECLTRERGVASSSLTVVVLCSCAGHINPCLVLVQPRKTRPDIAKKLLAGM